MITLDERFGGYQPGSGFLCWIVPAARDRGLFCDLFLWGTTFLAIRVAVEELPSLFAAGLRFFWRARCFTRSCAPGVTPRPTRLQWRNLGLIALIMFVAEYGPLFWAEKFVPSGIVSVLAATIPILTLISEMLILRQQRFRWSVALSSLIGFAGVGILLLRGNGQTFAFCPALRCLRVA